MPPDYLPLQRSLCLLRRLLIAPADRDTLAAYVEDECDPGVYGDLTHKAAAKRFENDLQRLRDWGVDLRYADGDYHVVSLGDFSPVALDDDGLTALAFLQETFAPGAPWAEAVQALIARIADWLPPPQAASLPARRQRRQVDLQRSDTDPLDPALQTQIERAIAQRRLLRFVYHTPAQADGALRRHTVQPWRVVFDAGRRHLYLEAYRVLVEGPHGEWREGQWARYRLGRIVAESVETLPDKFAPLPPKRPRVRLEYWLAPEIARGGVVSRHFEEMQTHETNAEGWVRVSATTDDLFGALRLLLGYGPNCRVTGGTQARREMAALVQGLAALYPKLEGD